MANFPDPVQLEVGESATVTFLKSITDLNGPGKPMGKFKKPGWITRVNQGGTEKTLFLDQNERDQLVDANVGPGSVFEIKQVAPYKKAFEIEYQVGTDSPVVNHSPAPAAPPTPGGPGWTTSSFDHKLTPDLAVVPKLENSAQSEIFARMTGPVGLGLAKKARKVAFEMLGLQPDEKITAAQLASLAPAIQDIHASFLIGWKDLGYPVTEWDAPYESGLADPDEDFD